MTPYLRLARSKATAACAFTLLVALAARADESPQQIMQRARDTYGQLRSYSDGGVVVREYGSAVSPSRDRNTFSTHFNRAPRRFYFEFNKQGGDRFVIWGDPDAFHTWWKTTGVASDYPNPNNLPALNQSDFQTGGSATKIPTLLYPKAAIVSSLSHFADATLEGTEDVGGHRCFKLVGRTNDVYGQTGKEVNFRRMSVWIDTSSALIRQIREESKAMPGQVNRVMTTFEPEANPALPESRFKFTPPEQQ
jgi:outer membrane lipoprotein-sorting protein